MDIDRPKFVYLWSGSKGDEPWHELDDWLSKKGQRTNGHILPYWDEPDFEKSMHKGHCKMHVGNGVYKDVYDPRIADFAIWYVILTLGLILFGMSMKLLVAIV